MSYAPPVITAAGLSVPSYADILASLTSTWQSIYGATVYLGNDAADYQMLSAFSLKISDVMGAVVLAYNSRSPLTAVGADLDGTIKLNGLTRKSASPSTVLVTLSGLSGTVITTGVVSDANGIYWDLPASVTIGSGGTVSVTATCEQLGAVSAPIGTVTNKIAGDTAGWISVTNSSPAVIGTVVETDSNLRARQSVSVALPSETRLAGTVAGIAAISGVTRYNVLENPTGATDAFGNEAHSMTAVVEGGTDLDVATAIYDNRGIGCNTQGATIPVMTIVDITDPNSGNITAIGFVRPVYVPIFVSLTVHGLNVGFTTNTQAAIKAALVAYLNSLQIGELVTQSALYGSALSVMANLSLPQFSIRALTLGTSASPSGTSDVAMAFYQVSSGLLADIVLTVV